MKLVLIIYGVVGILATTICCKSLPSTYSAHGNFGPSVNKVFKIFPSKTLMPMASLENPIDVATMHCREQVPVFSACEITSIHTSAHNGVTHVYLHQSVNGIPLANGVGNVNVGSNGQILSFGNSFFSGDYSPDYNKLNLAQTPLKSVEDAFSALTSLTQANSAAHIYGGNEPAMKYIQVEAGSRLRLAYDIVIESEGNVYNGIVDAETAEVIQLVNWVSDATYNAFPFAVNDPSTGERDLIKDPEHLKASPLGWHAQSEQLTFKTTIGNNVYAQENLDGTPEWRDNYRPENDDLVFNHKLDLTQGPSEYLDASITNLFYWNNIIHDLLYVYGFDEQAGNFQENNFGHGGKDNDAVYANTQDGAGLNNANFMTPPDGQKGRMRMYVWDKSNPRRDSSLDNGIVIHEYLHGLSNRLTGGSNDVSCLREPEAGGMGEGWGDIFATVLRMTETTTRKDDYLMGDYANGGVGIRKFPYSTKLDVNPSTYSFVTKPDYGRVHAKGEVWAVILYEVYWNLVEKHGFDPDWFNVNPNDIQMHGMFKSIIDGQKYPRPNRPNKGLGGNIIFLQLLVDGMKLQPCSPVFVESRDSILEADQINNNGENKCEIWKGFAKRGLGVDAEYFGINGFEIPVECQ